MNTTPTGPASPTGSAGSTPPDARTPTRVSLCGHCGHPHHTATLVHHTATPTRRCDCIPAEVWTEPETARAVRDLDLGALIRLVRAHPRTRHLPQTSLAAMTGLSQTTVSRLESGTHANVGVHRCRQALTGLGAPPPQDDTPPQPRPRPRRCPRTRRAWSSPARSPSTYAYWTPPTARRSPAPSGRAKSPFCPTPTAPAYSSAPTPPGA